MTGKKKKELKTLKPQNYPIPPFYSGHKLPIESAHYIHNECEFFTILPTDNFVWHACSILWSTSLWVCSTLTVHILQSVLPPPWIWIVHGPEIL